MPAYKDSKTNTWVSSFRFVDTQGNKVSKKKRNFRTKKEALLWEDEYKLSYNGNVNMAFKSFLKIYFKDKEGSLRDSTVRQKKKLFELHILPYFKNYKLADIKSIDIIRWQNKIKTLGLAQTYLRTLHNQITAILNHAVKYYGLKENPVHKVGAMGEKYSENNGFYTYEEYLRLKEVIDDKMLLCIVNILFLGGLRRGELLALTKRDFDFKNNTITINKSLNDINQITEPKTKKSYRTISMPAKIMDEIKSYIDTIYKCKKDQMVFTIHKASLGRVIHGYADLAGLKRITIHQFRHSHISHLHELGFNFQEIADRVGHDDTNTTIRIYTHCNPAKQEEIAETLNTLIL